MYLDASYFIHSTDAAHWQRQLFASVKEWMQEYYNSQFEDTELRQISTAWLEKRLEVSTLYNVTFITDVFNYQTVNSALHQVD